MSVHTEGEKIVLKGNCPVEDAEPLLTLLQKHQNCPVDLSEALHLHTAVVQVLLAYRRELSGQSRDLFLKTWVIPLFNSMELNGPA